MDRFDEIKLNIKKKRMILLSKSSECLLPLQEELSSCDKKNSSSMGFLLRQRSCRFIVFTLSPRKSAERSVDTHQAMGAMQSKDARSKTCDSRLSRSCKAFDFFRRYCPLSCSRASTGHCTRNRIPDIRTHFNSKKVRYR